MNNEYKEMLERFDQICQNAKKELLCAKEEKEKQKRFLKKIDKELTITEYDEIKYWLANVEILDKTDYILHNRKAKILIKYLKEKDKELDKYKNIVDEIEECLTPDYEEYKKLIDKRDYLTDINDNYWLGVAETSECVLDKLKELKGSDE